jgi:hypothetical protein
VSVLRSRWAQVLVQAAALALQASSGAAAWRQQEFVLGGCYTGGALDPERFVRIQRAGLNLVINGDRSDRVDAQRTSFLLDSLRFARPGFDLKLIVSYRKGPDSSRIAFNPEAQRHVASLTRTLGPRGGIDRPSVEGWWVWDEPVTTGDLQAVGDLIALLGTVPPTRDRLAFVSLLPASASGQPAYDRIHGRDKRLAYRRYLERVLSVYKQRGVPVPLLCADHYPFERGDARDDFFLTLETLRDAVSGIGEEGNRTPFWIVVQLSPARIEGDRYRGTPTIPQIRWQVSMAIAHGAKGILYWTLVPSGPGEYGAGLLDRDGRPTSRYEAVRDYDLEVRSLGPTLMKLAPVAVRHQSAATRERAGSGTSGGTRSVVKQIRGGGGQGLVGHLRDEGTGEDYLFVVNGGVEKSADYRIDLAEECAGVLRITSSDGVPVRVASRGRSFGSGGLAPGSGALFRIEAMITRGHAR